MGIRPQYYDHIDWTPNVQIDKGIGFFETTTALTTETTTDAISMPRAYPINPNNLYCLSVRRPINDTAGDLTVNVYNVDIVDATSTSSDMLHSSHTVEQINGAVTNRDFLVRGLFAGSENQIKLGFDFATDDSGVTETIYYKISRL